MEFSSIGWPVSFNVRCPSCGGRATFDEPFAFLSGSKKDVASEGLQAHRWGGWLVVEKYPSLLPWKAPHGSHQIIVFSEPNPPNGEYVYHQTGVIRCEECFRLGVHKLNWPDDAYYRWDIRGHVLWAWSAEHAHALLSYIDSRNREVGGGPYARNLLRLPKEFLDAKVRERIVKLIRGTLS